MSRVLFDRSDAGPGDIVIPTHPALYDSQAAGGSNRGGWFDDFDRDSGQWSHNGTQTFDVGRTAGSHLFSHVTDSGTNFSHHYRKTPGAPFTVTAKYADQWTVLANPSDAGLAVTDADPNDGYLQIMCGSSFSGSITNIETVVWNSLTSFNTTLDHIDTSGYGRAFPPCYLRIRVNSSSSVDFQFSFTGMVWTTVRSAYDPTGAIGSWTPSNVMLTLHPGTGATGESLWDWVKVTVP